MPTIIQTFPNPNDLLGLEPEELGLVLLELIPTVIQNGLFMAMSFEHQMYPSVGPRYPDHLHQNITNAIAEAFGWLETQGLVVQDPGQPAKWLRLTRRAQKLKSRADIEAYRGSLSLPSDLLQPVLIERVRPIYVRGDYDIAVFQAFRQVEIAVRAAANARGAGFADDLVGVKLMRAAFHPDTGPLTDQAMVAGEREAQMHLFAGAIGHAKNPPGHRDVGIKAKESARLIVMASHLLDVVERIL